MVEVLPGGRHSLLTEQEFVDKYSKSAIVAELRQSIDGLGSVIALLGVERAAAKAASARNIAGSEAAIAPYLSIRQAVLWTSARTISLLVCRSTSGNWIA